MVTFGGTSCSNSFILGIFEAVVVIVLEAELEVDVEEVRNFSIEAISG